MTKVWVPIDLPEGMHPRSVMAVDELGVSWTFTLIDLPKSEPHAERWLYRILEISDIGQTALAANLACNALGAEGWECFHVNPGAVWFKRRIL